MKQTDLQKPQAETSTTVRLGLTSSGLVNEAGAEGLWNLVASALREGREGRAFLHAFAHDNALALAEFSERGRAREAPLKAVGDPEFLNESKPTSGQQLDLK